MFKGQNVSYLVDIMKEKSKRESRAMCVMLDEKNDKPVIVSETNNLLVRLLVRIAIRITEKFIVR